MTRRGGPRPGHRGPPARAKLNLWASTHSAARWKAAAARVGAGSRADWVRTHLDAATAQALREPAREAPRRIAGRRPGHADLEELDTLVTVLCARESRDQWTAASVRAGAPSLSDWVRDLLNAECDRLERLDGRPLVEEE